MTQMDKPQVVLASRRPEEQRAPSWSRSAMPVEPRNVLSIKSAAAQARKPPLAAERTRLLHCVNADGSVSAFFGKMDMGQGLFTAIGQIVAEELDVPFNQVKVIMGDTATSVNQGGASGSTGIQNGGKQMRAAAAEARRILNEMAAAKLGAQSDKLIVVDGIVRVLEDLGRSPHG